ncbi:unknown [Coraliomargarita sp. CAG:312]|nr:unknown [Coraliomargarita sp. CAG:312]
MRAIKDLFALLVWFASFTYGICLIFEQNYSCYLSITFFYYGLSTVSTNFGQQHSLAPQRV